MKKLLHSMLSLGLAFGFGIAISAQITNVLNSAADLSGKTLVTAEGNRIITGTFTYSVPARFSTGTAGNPGIVASTDTTTGEAIGVGTIGWSLAGTQRMLLNSSGLTIYGVNVIDNTGAVAGAVPSGAIFYFNGACPTGYTEFTNAQGNYIVGLKSGGTLNTQVGTVLTNQENRPAGQHTHILTMDPHNHGIHGVAAASGGGSTGIADGGGTTFFAVADNATVTGTAANNAGSVAGTNAPYIQLRACQKT
jgi:hypothetical protein